MNFELFKQVQKYFIRGILEWGDFVRGDIVRVDIVLEPIIAYLSELHLKEGIGFYVAFNR